MELLSKVTRPTSTCDPARRRTYSGRKLPGFTVASDAPLLLSLTSVAHIYDELKTQSVLEWSQAGELGVFSVYWLLFEAKCAIMYPSATTLPPQVTVNS